MQINADLFAKSQRPPKMATRPQIINTALNSSNGTPQKAQQPTSTQQAGQQNFSKPTMSPQKQSMSTSSSGHFPPLSITMDWIIKVLGVAAALVFGIWAPISYQASEASNSDTDTKFSALSSELSAWKTSAVSLQTSAASDLSRMSKKMDAVATLSVFDFCQGRSSISACVSVTRSVDVDALVSSFVPPSGVGSRSSTTNAASPTASSGSDARPPEDSGVGGRGSLALPAILGIVFGVVVFVGLLTGYIVWRRRQKRKQSLIS
ncbi:unnamed protein product [Periconia digitata]|uniref:Uncharacterized protein n=1 Tax=Periconia digitata TaxID=1303443 RepID=A0A9W4U205_9PLEO|nr:unnamed protein product [Periconia digitata]